jgi:hypothetical protein
MRRLIFPLFMAAAVVAFAAVLASQIAVHGLSFDRDTRTAIRPVHPTPTTSPSGWPDWDRAAPRAGAPNPPPKGNPPRPSAPPVRP